MVLWVSLFLYMRHKIMMLEDRVALLSKLTTTVAGLTAQNGQDMKCCVADMNVKESEKESENESVEESDAESDESDADCDADCDEECDVDCEVVCNMANQVIEREFPILKNILLTPCCMPDIRDPVSIVELTEVDVPEPLVDVLTEVIHETIHETIQEYEPVDVNLPKRKVSEDNVKTLVVNLDYDSMSVKDLKEKVAEVGGPKLKTKKDLVEFLKNKI